MIALCGVVDGFGLRRWKGLQHVNSTICFMLFVLGLSVGENRLIVSNLWSYGSQALLISLASILGSAISGWALYKYVLKSKQEERAA